MQSSRALNQLPKQTGEFYYPARTNTQPFVTDLTATSPTVNLNDVVRPILRRKWLILSAALVGIAGGILLTAVMTPVYRARTSLQLEGFNDNYFLRDLAPVAPQIQNASAQNYLENEVKILQSETLARRVAARLKKEPRPAHAEPAPAWGFAGVLNPWHTPATPDTYTVRHVQRALKVETSLQSQVIEVYYSDPDPEVAAQAANDAVEEFIAMNREARWQIVEDTAAALGKQTAELKSKVEAASRDLDDYAKRSGLVFAGGGQTTLGADRMRQLEDALAKAQADRVAKQSRYEAALASPVDALPDSLVTGPLRQYETDLENMNQQLAEARTLYTPAHYKVKRLEAKIAETQKAVAAERNAIVARLKTEYQAAVGAETRLTAADGGQLKTIQSETAKELQYEVRKRELETTQHLYDSVLEKVKAAGVASALSGTNVRVIDKAFPPPLPYSPDIPLNTAIGLALGMLGGIGMVFLRGPGNKFVRPGDAAVADLPELGVILSAKDHAALETPHRNLLALGPKNPELGLATWHQDSSLFAESFRSTLASIVLSDELSAGEAAGRFSASGVLVISSVEPTEGKSTVVANLGVAFAETKRRVLLIDADLRRPRLHGIFNICNDWGLSDLVQSSEPVSTMDFSKAARPTEVPGLWLLPSGPGCDGISKLLYSDRLGDLLAGFRKEFDLVLFDTPPAKFYPDARVLGRMADGVIIVVRAKKTQRDDVNHWREVLMRDGTPIVGTILNDCPVGTTNYRAYSQYYKRDCNFA